MRPAWATSRNVVRCTLSWLYRVDLAPERTTPMHVRQTGFPHAATQRCASKDRGNRRPLLYIGGEDHQTNDAAPTSCFPVAGVPEGT